jgi:prepilin-type N-terminal cleavage/methylation domain-containing protein
LVHNLLIDTVEATNMRNKMGFTLMELLVVIAILAIVASLAVPSFISWRNNAKLRDGASLLRVDLERTKLRAVKENSFVALLFNAGSYTAFVDDGAGDPSKAGDWVKDGSEQLVCNRQLPAGVTIDLADPDMFANDRIRFNARGRVSNDGAVTLVNIAGDEKEIGINRFGMITVD